MLAHLLAFTGVAAFLTVSPGPDFAVVVRRSITGGRWHGIACGIGVTTGLFAWGVASAVGISALLAASTSAYDGPRIAGDRARGWFRRERIRRAVNRVTGGMLVGFGVAAASEVLR